jgi:hypothetical protein
MTAFKFLKPGRVAPFTGVAWPEAGAWLETAGEPALCTSGIHALRPSALPLWLAEELWRVDLDGEREVAPGLVVAPRGRLLERIDAWNDRCAREFSDSCLAALPAGGRNPVADQRAADAVDAARDVTAGASAAAVAYIAARAAESDRPDGYREERSRQAGWLQQRMGL